MKHAGQKAQCLHFANRGVTNTKCGDSQSRPKSIDGETSGNSIGFVSKFSSLCHVTTVPLRNR
jgi:hypothetical protein